MGALEGKLRKLHVESVRQDLEYYARAADECARKTEKYTTNLALEAEGLNKNAGGFDYSVEEMNTRYKTLEDEAGNKLFLEVDTCETGAFLSLASGCGRVPLTEDVLRQLAVYEQLKPGMMRMYDEVEHIDGVFLFDTESNIATFRTEYMFADDLQPGIDLAAFYDIGLIFYDWFGFVDKELNPARKARWSSLAFIAVEHDWIMHLKAPIYRNRYLENEEMIGIIGIHLNLDWLVANTIGNSGVRMMVVKDNSTLVGLNEAAKKDIPLKTYDKKELLSINGFDPAVTQMKKKFVFETLNLDHDKGEDVESFSMRLKSEFQFDHTLFGKTYTVLRETAPELGLYFVALLENA